MIGDYDIDVSAGTAVVTLARRIRAVRSEVAPIGSDAPGVLEPPISASRDHIAGPQWASALLMVFGAYGMPWSRPLGRLLDGLRRAHPGSVCVAWRHLPDPEADPRTVWLALAAEAAATESRFWAMHRELIAMRHDDPQDLHAAARRAGVDYYRLVDRMSAGTGADRIVADVESARDSMALYAPTLFINGERFRGDLDVASVSAALQTEAHG